MGTGACGKKAFEADCNCELKFVALEDGVSLLNRLRMEGKNSKADVVLGLDNNLLEAATQTKLFAKSGISPTPLPCLAAGKTTPSFRLTTAGLRSFMTKTS
jgi:ABC transporter substrate-binding protein (ThiB subfamily)